MIGPCSGLFGLYGFENGKRCRHVNFYCQKILKSQKNYENLDFSTCGLCLAFKNFFGLFSIFMAFRHLEYSKLFKFELLWSNFAIEKIGKPDQVFPLFSCAKLELLKISVPPLKTVNYSFRKNFRGVDRLTHIEMLVVLIEIAQRLTYM